MQDRSLYAITAKGRSLLHGPAAWALTRHARDLLALCDPQVSIAQARQFLPPESLYTSLYSLRALELVEGPPVKLPAAAHEKRRHSGAASQPPGSAINRAGAA